jgi:hypothetical protein
MARRPLLLQISSPSEAARQKKGGEGYGARNRQEGLILKRAEANPDLCEGDGDIFS